MVRNIPTKGAGSFIVRGSRGCVLVDTGMDKDLRTLEDGLRSAGMELEDVRLVVITHAHLDHYGALAAFHRVSGAPIAAHRLEAPYIERGEQSPTIPRNGAGRFFNTLVRNMRNERCPVDLVVDECLDLSEYGVDGQVIRTPGHTPGSLSVVTSDGEAIVGDLFRGKSGRRSPGWFCADESALRESLAAIAARRPRKIYLAHGPEADFEELERFRVLFAGASKT